MDWRRVGKLCPLSCLITALLFKITLARLAVMSVDLGGEFMKIAIVKPGVPMEIVINKESSRKTRAIVAFRDGERLFANEAYNAAVRFPTKAFWFLTHIIGRNYEDAQVQQFIQRFPYYGDRMTKDEERGTVLFRDFDGGVHSCEELLAMLLEKAREYAQDFAEQRIEDAVITVPPYYSQAERRAVLAAANLAGMNVLQLMTDSAAVALNYGVFRRKNFNSTVQYYMFYDMGATSTVVSIVGYKMVKSQVGTRVESNPQLTVMGIGYDRQLGGLEMTLRLRDHLAEEFNAKKKRPIRVQDNPRAMAKLQKEAERVKKVLSANSEHTAQVEGLLDGEDFSCKVTREKYLHLIDDLLERVTLPVQQVLTASQITWAEITEIILMGGGSRLPKVHEILLNYSGKKELGKSVNTDEAGALGAVYQAAYLAKGFKVKTFHVRDANLYPINVEFAKQTTDEEGSEDVKVIQRTLFGRSHYFPQKKVMTFNTHYVKDFTFDLRYGDLDFLDDEEKKLFSSSTLSRVGLKGVDKAYTKRSTTATYKGVKAHFRMDSSGLLHLDMAESVFEEGLPQQADDSTWSKLGSAIGNMFGGEEEKDNAQQTDDTGKDKPTSKDKKTDGQKEKKKEGEKKENQKKEKTTDKNKKAASPAKGLNEKLKVTFKIKDMTELSKDQVKQSKKRLSDWRKRDEEKAAVEKARNEIESFIINAQDKMTRDTYMASSTDDERSTILDQLSQASDWLYEQSHQAKKVVFTNKHRDLRNLLKKVEDRVKETEGRPAALATLTATLKSSATFLRQAQDVNSRSPSPVYSESDLTALDKLIIETSKWQEDGERKQAKRGPNKDPSLLIQDIQAKVKALEREVKFLKNKKKNASKQAPKTKANKTVKENKKSEENKKEEKNTNNGQKNSEEKKNTVVKEKVTEEKKKTEEDDDEDGAVEDEEDESYVLIDDSQEPEDASSKKRHRDSGHIEL